MKRAELGFEPTDVATNESFEFTFADYLEPIINHANVRQNQEYFGNYGHSLKNQDINEEVNLIGFPETPTQIIMPDHYGPSFLATATAAENRQNSKDIYYNDGPNAAVMRKHAS